jgi:hypothetical protein
MFRTQPPHSSTCVLNFATKPAREYVAWFSSRVLDAVLARVGGELLTQPVSIRLFAIQFEVVGVHEPSVVPADPAA